MEFFLGGKGCTPSEVEVAFFFIPWKVTLKGPLLKESSVSFVFDGFSETNAMHNSYCGNLKHPLGISRNSAANRSMFVAMHALMHCLFSQDSTKSLGSKKTLTKVIRNFKPAMAQARFTTRCALLLLMEEILHQLIGRLSHYFQGFIHPMGCGSSSINLYLVGAPCTLHLCRAPTPKLFQEGIWGDWNISGMLAR